MRRPSQARDDLESPGRTRARAPLKSTRHRAVRSQQERLQPRGTPPTGNPRFCELRRIYMSRVAIPACINRADVAGSPGGALSNAVERSKTRVRGAELPAR